MEGNKLNRVAETGFSKADLVRSVIAISLLILLAACRHTPYVTSFDWVDGIPSIRGVAVDNDRLLSYSTLPGSLPSKRRDYVEIMAVDTVAIEGHRTDSAALAFLALECCMGKTVGQTLMGLPAASTQASGIDFSDMDVEIVLVPLDTEYAYVTRHRMSRPKVRFAFHYDPRKPDVAVARIVRTFAHETKHILSALQRLPKPNRVSDEVSAILMGICASYAQVGQLPKEIAGILPEPGIMDDIRATLYDEAIERMAGTPPPLMGQIIAQLEYENLLSARGLDGFEALCRDRGYLGHDFLRSSFVSSQR